MYAKQKRVHYMFFQLHYVRDAFGSTYELSVTQCHAGIYCLCENQSLVIGMLTGQGCHNAESIKYMA